MELVAHVAEYLEYVKHNPARNLDVAVLSEAPHSAFLQAVHSTAREQAGLSSSLCEVITEPVLRSRFAVSGDDVSQVCPWHGIAGGAVTAIQTDRLKRHKLLANAVMADSRDCDAALPRKQTNSRLSRHFRFVPRTDSCAAASGIFIRSHVEAGPSAGTQSRRESWDG